MTKQMVFISHIHENQHTANVLEDVIKKALLGGLEVFNSSNRKSIAVGDPWRDIMIERLRKSSTLLVLATPESVASPWVNFEAGGAWIAGNRVIPCCANGMTKSSLPSPLNHLQAIDLSSPDDLKTLIKFLANLADLDTPQGFDFQGATETIISSWREIIHGSSNEKFAQWIKNASIRPRACKGETCRGLVKISNLSAVTPIESSQFYDEKIIAGVSVSFWLSPIGNENQTIYNCFANDPIASSLFSINTDDAIEVTAKCLGQIKTYETIMGDEGGVSFSLALLITDVKEIYQNT